MEEKLYRSKEAVEAFLATPEKFYWYKNAFQKYDVNGIDNLSWNWSWYAFFFGPLYLVYRKCYIEAILVQLALVVGSVVFPLSSFIFSVIVGGFSPYLIFKKYKKVTTELDKNPNLSFDEKIDSLRRIGGVNRIARNIYIGFLLFCFFCFIFLFTLGVCL